MAEAGWGSWGGAVSPSPPARGSGEGGKLPVGVPAQPRHRADFLYNF